MRDPSTRCSHLLSGIAMGMCVSEFFEMDTSGFIKTTASV